MSMAETFPALRAVVLDATDARVVAEFYRVLLGYVYRAGDETPPPGQPDPRGEDWLVLRDRNGDARLAIQRVAVHRHRALSLGAAELLDRSADPDEPLYVLADPAGHPFCIFVSPDHPN